MDRMGRGPQLACSKRIRVRAGDGDASEKAAEFLEL